MRFQLRTLRDPAPDADEALGQFLVDLVREAVPRRAAAPVILSRRGARVDLVDLREVAAAQVDGGWLVSVLTRSTVDGVRTAVDAVGLMGVFTWRRARGETGIPAALVFLEWPDGRWWQWRALMDAAGQLRADTETIARAVDGLARPAGLGGWWTAGRRHGLSARISPNASKPPQAPYIH